MGLRRRRIRVLKKRMMMSNISQEDKEKAATIVRLFSELGRYAQAHTMGELTSSLKKNPNGGNDMEVTL